MNLAGTPAGLHLLGLDNPEVSQRSTTGCYGDKRRDAALTLPHPRSKLNTVISGRAANLRRAR